MLRRRREKKGVSSGDGEGELKESKGWRRGEKDVVARMVMVIRQDK